MDNSGARPSTIFHRSEQVFAVAILQSDQFCAVREISATKRSLRITIDAGRISPSWLGFRAQFQRSVALPGQQPQLRRWSVTDTARDRSGNRRLGMHIPAA
jgi:hypothetical protein